MNEEIEDEVNQRRRVGRLDDFKEEKFWRGDARRQPIDVRKGGWTVGLALPVKQPYLHRCEMANFLYRRDQSVGL